MLYQKGLNTGKIAAHPKNRGNSKNVELRVGKQIDAWREEHFKVLTTFARHPCYTLSFTLP
jgi:hypothetical protein